MNFTFGDKDLLQHISLARILFGEVIPLRRDARYGAPPLIKDFPSRALCVHKG